MIRNLIFRNAQKNFLGIPKTKKIIENGGIVEIKGELKKKYQIDYCLTVNSKKTIPNNITEYFMNPMTQILGKSENFIIPIKVRRFTTQEITLLKPVLQYCSKFKTSEASKTKGLEKANNELTLSEIHHNVKKYEKHTTNDLLHSILKNVKEYKKKHGKVDFFIFDEIKEKLVIENDVIIGLENKNKTNKRKTKNTI